MYTPECCSFPPAQATAAAPAPAGPACSRRRGPSGWRRGGRGQLAAMVVGAARCPRPRPWPQQAETGGGRGRRGLFCVVYICVCVGDGFVVVIACKPNPRRQSIKVTHLPAHAPSSNGSSSSLSSLACGRGWCLEEEDGRRRWTSTPRTTAATASECMHVCCVRWDDRDEIDPC